MQCLTFVTDMIARSTAKVRFQARSPQPHYPVTFTIFTEGKGR